MTAKKYITYHAVVLIFSLQLIVALAAPGQAQSPVGYWTFDDGSGTQATDSSGNGHTATLVNGVSWVPGEIGGAVSAKAAKQQYVSIPAIDLSSTQAVTVTLWANRNYSRTGGHALFEATSNYTNSITGFGFFPDDATCSGIQAALRGDVGYTANCYSQPSSGVWHHLAVVFDKSQSAGNQVRFYVDGVLQSVTQSLYASTNTNNFGNNSIYLFSQAGITQFNSGAIDDFRIYNTALTAAQVQQIYKASTLVSLAVTPSNSAIVSGIQQQFTATGTYKDGSKKDLTGSAIWTSSAPSIANISSGGLATALAPGSTTITATSGSISGSTSLSVTTPVLVSIAVTPANGSIAAGQQQQFTATGTYKDGSKKDLTSSATWTSSATSVATISSAGLATGMAAGSTTIKATSGSVSGSTSLTAIATADFTIAASPVSLSVVQGNQGTSTITTAISGGFNNAITLSASGVPSGTTVSFSPNPIAAPGAGSSTMTISVGASTSAGTYPITVTGNGGGIQHTAALTLTVTSRTISYVQGNYATPQTQSTVNVTFTAAQAAGDLNVVVVGWGDSTAVVKSVADHSGNPYTLGVGPTVVSGVGSQSIYYAKNIAAAAAGANTVTVTFASAAAYPDIRILEYNGADPTNPVDITAANTGNSTTSSSGSATTTNPTDLIFGANVVATMTTGPGSGFTQRLLTPNGQIAEDQIVTTTGSYSTSAPLNSAGPWIMQMVAFRTDSPPLVSIAVTPTNASIADGQQQQFTATGTYSDGSHQNLTNTATWTSSAPSIATVSSAGLATAVAVGSATIQATSGSINGSTGLTVTAPVLVSIAVTPANASIAAGQRQQFTATGTYTDGSHQNLTATATWTSTAPSIATINSAGLATAVAAGSTTIQATSGSINGSTGLTVTAATLVSIAVTPANPSIAAGQKQQFTATGTYTDGSHQNLTATATWTSSATSIATIAAGGLATALAPGSTTITATSGSISGSTSLSVTTPVLVSIAVTPANGSIAAGQQQQFTATGTYKDGSKKDLTSSATWTSSATSVATISSAGLATGMAAGSTTIKATSGSVSGSTSLTAIATADFTIAASPVSLSVVQGNQGTSTITTAISGGFNNAITLSASGVPSGTTVSFSPNPIAAPGAGSSTMTISVGASTSAGTYPITVTGNGGGIQHTAALTLTVTSRTISYVQGNYATPQTQSTVNVTFTAAQAAGDLNVVVVGWGDSTAVVKSVADHSGNPYTLGVGPTVVSGVGSQSIYYAKNIAAAAAGANTVTVTFASAAAYPDIRILEYNGADPTNPVDITAANTGNSTTSSSGSATTTNPTDLIFGANVVATMTTGPGSGFTQRLLTPNGQIAEDQIVTTTGSYSTSAPLNSAGPWIMQMVAFRTDSPPLVSIAVTPTNASIADGQQQQFTATGTYSDGSHQNLTNTATWTSSAPSIATVSSAGLATAVAVGSATIQATSGSINGSTGLTVTAPVLVSIAVTPANASIAAGQRQQFTATGTYTDGSHQNLTATATWTSTAPSIATINSAGLATAVAAGSTTIQATSGSISGATSLTVTAQPLLSLSWNASTSTGIIGYNAYRSPTSGGPYTMLNSNLISVTNYNDQTVQSGFTYYYVTTAVDSNGMESPYSNEAIAIIP